MQIMELLKKNTRLMHIEIMHQPYFQDLLKNRLSIELYFAELLNLKEIYSALGNSIENKIEFDIKKLLNDYKLKIDSLKKDLNFVGNKYQIITYNISKTTTEICNIINISNELELIGIIYVFEGSTLGSNILIDRLKKTFEFKDLGIEFLCHVNLGTRERWKNLSEELNKKYLLEEDQQIVMTSALNIFRMLNKFYVELYKN